MINTDEFKVKSKTQQKRDAEAAQVLGAKLIELSESQINEMTDKLELPDKLHEALLTCRTMKAREARRRQLQYIGKLMRDIELEPIQKILAEYKQGRSAETVQLHKIEHWRDHLLKEGESALKELLQHNHEIDANHVRKLIASAHRESLHKQPPRAARLLFKYLRDFLKD